MTGSLQPPLAENKVYNTYMLMITVGLSIIYALAILLRLFINCCRKYHDRIQQQEKRKLRSFWAKKMKTLKAGQRIYYPTSVDYPPKTLHLKSQATYQKPPHHMQEQLPQQQYIQVPLSQHSSISSVTLKNATASPSSIEQPSKPLIRAAFLKELFHSSTYSNLEKLEEVEEEAEEEGSNKSYCSLKIITPGALTSERTTNISSSKQQQQRVVKLPLDLLELPDYQQQDNRSAKADFTRKFRLKSKRIHCLSKVKKLDLLWQWSLSMGYCEYTHAVALNELVQRLTQQQPSTITESR